ncbi:MAG: glycosyltransferase family 2 protein [Chloroflexi bacterium]|nr:glycosyltransferase family 2 protein [Chloroflexota bacterium]
MTSSLVVLTFNEVDGMRQVMPQVDHTWVEEIVIVDGGSTDGTLEEAQRQGLRAVIQEKPGRGEAFRVGLRHSTGDIIVYFSPDGNERPGDIPILLGKMGEGYDMVIASRFGKDSRSEDATWITRLGNWAFTTGVNLFFGAHVTDAVNGLRAVTRPCMEDLATTAVHFEIEMEMTIRAAKKGYRIGEIPTVEPPRVGGKPKLNKIVDGLRYSRFFLGQVLSGRR